MIIIKKNRAIEQIPNTEDEVLALTSYPFKDLGAEQKEFITFCTHQAIFLDVKYSELFLSSNASIAHLALDLNARKNYLMSSCSQNLLPPPLINETEQKWLNLSFQQKIAFIIMGLLRNKEFIKNSEKELITTFCIELLVKYLLNANYYDKEIESIINQLSNQEIDRLSIMMTESQKGRTEFAEMTGVKSGPTL